MGSPIVAVAWTPAQQRSLAEAMEKSRQVRYRADGSAYNVKTGKPVFGGMPRSPKKESLADYKARMKRLRLSV